MSYDEEDTEGALAMSDVEDEEPLEGGIPEDFGLDEEDPDKDS